MTQSFYVLTLCPGSVIKKEEAFFFWTRSASNVPQTLHISLTITRSPLSRTEWHHLHCYMGNKPWTYRDGTIGIWRSKGRSFIASVGWMVECTSLTYYLVVTLFFHYNSICVYIRIPLRIKRVPKLLPHVCHYKFGGRIGV
jgi:hypothetical protein